MSPKLSELITLLKGHRVFIQTHNFPDPDAIASAFGLQVLLERFKIPTTICHHGNVERTATANMVSEFGIKMTEDTELEDMTWAMKLPVSTITRLSARLITNTRISA